MSLISALFLRLGTSLAKTVIKRWFQDQSFALDASVSVINMLETKLPDVLTQRRAQAMLDNFAVEIADMLLPFFELEAGVLPENEKEAAVLAVIDTFERTSISEKSLFDRNLDPRRLEDLIRAGNNNAARDLAEPAEAFYNKLLAECCTYVVEITSILPRFNLRVAQDLLKRTSEIHMELRKILTELPKLNSRQNADDAFVLEYRRAIARKLDQLFLFGITISDEFCRRYCLSVAYITLTAAKPVAQRHEDQSGDPSGSTEGDDFCRVDKALAGSRRILIRGEAGSGKTTLLQWLAVRAARDDFGASLADWRGQLPFFLQLRRWLKADLDLPKPEQFIDQIAPNLTGDMPKGWVTRQLKAGALILVDGIDEVPNPMRPFVKAWIDGLAQDFPESRIVVTSRPAAAEEGWLAKEGFDDSELQPMDLEDIQSLIEQWHEAAKQDRPESEKTELDIYKTSLKETVRSNAPIRRLSVTPLLCAMICALHWDRRQHVPSDRMELYRIALEMLLDRRETERGMADFPQFAKLNMRSKESLLRNFAYWLMRNNRSDAQRDEAQQCLNRAQKSFSGNKYNLSELLQFLLERSGLLREPIEGRIDFIHRTFQEFLAAKQAILERDIDFLINNAHLPEWRETLILAAGHAGEKDADKLVSGLLERAATEPKRRHSMVLLAIGCLETAIDLPAATRAKVRIELAAIMPPKSMAETNDVAAAGEIAIPHLRGQRHKSGKIVTACIRALTNIGGEASLMALKEYTNDWRTAVIRELFRAQTYFDQPIMDTLNWKWPILELCSSKINDLSSLRNLTQLQTLNLAYCEKICDLSPLRKLTNLRTLNLAGCDKIIDIEPLSDLPNLEELFLTSANIDLSSLSSLISITKLNLRVGKNTNWSALADIGKLEDLTLFFGNEPSNIDPGFFGANLKEITFICAPVLPNNLFQGKQLKSLTLHTENRSFSLAPLAALTGLESLALTGCIPSTEFRAISGLTGLKSLILTGCQELTSLEPLAPLKHLHKLSVNSCRGITDLAPLAGLAELRELSLSGCLNIEDISPLGNLLELQNLMLQSCSLISSLEALGSLSKLQRLIAPSASLYETLPREHPCRQSRPLAF